MFDVTLILIVVAISGISDHMLVDLVIRVISDNEGVSRALKAETAQPVPRVRPEATEIAEQHKGVIKNLIVDVSNKPKNS